MPAFITGICVAPGATNPGAIGASIVEQSRLIAPNIEDVVVDRGYSTKREKFCRRLHKQGINVTMDYTSTNIDNPKPIKVGRKGQRLLISCGTLFPLWIPEKMQIPPEDADTDWYADRSLWRWTRNRKLDNGGGQFSCSQCAGRVTTKAPTRNPDAIPNKAAPFLPIEDEQCCHGMVSITADLLDASQDIPFGTPAHDKSYGRRNPSEKTISMIKDKGGLKAGWCRSFGLAAHNLKQTFRVERTQTQKPTAPARPKSHHPTRRNILADSLSARAPPG